jgi:hypothetical protein
MIKVPKEIAEFYNVKKGDTIKLAVHIVPDEKNTNEFEVIHETHK